MSELICFDCHKTFSTDQVRWRCDCGGLLDLHFVPTFDRRKITSRAPTLWRYREAIPIDSDENIVSFGEGYTPLINLTFGKQKVWIKQDHIFPSGSYKDRGASILISKVKELGIDHVVEDSSGNAGCAIASYAARAGIKCDIYVPESTSPAKLAQIQMSGAHLHKIPGTREDTARTVMEAASLHYYASHSWNPFFFQGTKTFAYEVCEQLGWQAPDVVILPVGNGTLLLGSWIGFNDLYQAGVINRLPQLIAVQSDGCAPLAKAFATGSTTIPAIEIKKTLAEGIAIAAPVRGHQIIHAVKSSGGFFITVSENEILKSLKWVLQQGFYIEPTAAAAIAGVEKYIANYSTEKKCFVSVFSGHGLKSTEKMLNL